MDVWQWKEGWVHRTLWGNSSEAVLNNQADIFFSISQLYTFCAEHKGVVYVVPTDTVDTQTPCELTPIVIFFSQYCQHFSWLLIMEMQYF